MSKTIYTAIFGECDTLKIPRVVTPGWRYICFTNKNFKSNIWEIVQIPNIFSEGERRMARHFKIMFHKYIEDVYSIWIDGSFTINTNLDFFWSTYFKSPITCMKHPVRSCAYHEGAMTVQNRRGGVEFLSEQLKYYNQQGLPANNGLIQSGILLREKTDQTVKFCEAWWNQVREFSCRDQISFAYVSYLMPIHHVANFDYRIDKQLIYEPHRTT